MRGVRGGLAALLLALTAAAVTVWAAPQAEDDFPHEKHERLFPLCIGCHEGVPEGDRTAFYPDPATCQGCHNGRRVRRISWTGPTQEVTNLRFSHPAHNESAGEELECARCHTERGAPRMAVQLAVTERCFGCHEATNHYVDADCAVCHVPLAQTRFTAARVEALPVPPSHQQPDFLEERHGELAQREPARCATCHTRELCTSCHVDAGQRPALQSIPPAGRQVGLPRFEARYPVPRSHQDAEWIEAHGEQASVAACATCHTRESCTTCHTGAGVPVVAQLPSARQGGAPGVVSVRRAPPSHASPSFLVQHGVYGATRPESCQTCHTQSSFCQSCHEPVAQAEFPAPRNESGLRSLPARTAPAGVLTGVPGPGVGRDTLPGGALGGLVQRPALARQQAAAQPRAQQRPQQFHPANFVARHSAAAYARRTECASCHNTQVFCQDCHRQMGFQAEGRLGAGFHDAQPLWLLRHGQAARQTLESCATCHAQRDCMQCHSQLGSFQVNPHGPGFDAKRAHERNPVVCRTCHLADPLEQRRTTP